jgi:hypothetical protein
VNAIPVRAVVRLVALITSVLVPAACGSSGRHAGASGTPGGGHTAFIASVDKVCARAVAAHQGHPFPVTGFDPENPNPDKLPAVANYFARYGGLPRIDATLHRLQAPSPDARKWHALLSLVDQVTANAQRQITAARAKDVTTFVQTVHTNERLTTRLQAAAGSFGLTSESDCSEVFG